ncbi:MAG: HNH endonuclease signature motif containing protein [Minwuia sp.]|nr:HNH endonuclease signature motif containing protein [Minwuia sp.]
MARRPNTFQSGAASLGPSGGKRARARAYNMQRPADVKRFYDSRKWRAARLNVLARDPMCGSEGCSNLATDVDHIRPIRDGGARLDGANLQALCHGCHARKTVREGGGGGSNT